VYTGAFVLLFLLGTAFLVGATLRLRSASELLLAAYVVAFAEVVGLTLFLSAFDSDTRGSLVAGAIVLFVAAAAVWFLVGQPSLPRLQRPSLGSRPVLVLGAVVAVALAYVVALIVGTPPNGWDPLNYHLARAAFWLQSSHVGYIGDAYDQRLNFNPPNGEIGLSFVLGVAREEMLAGFVQFSAAIASAVAVFCLARRFGLTRAEASFGSLLFLTLPIVLLQSSGAKNDVVVASFVLAACVFVLGSSRRELGLAALATALAIGTKFTAAYGLAVLFALALIAAPRLRSGRLIAVAVGAVVGSYWYLVNAVDTGALLGDQSNAGKLTAPLHPRENLLTAYGLLVDTLDLSGAQGRDLLLYVAAAVVVAVGLALAPPRSRRGVRSAVLAGGIVASPLVLLAASTHVGRPSLVRFYDFLGQPQGYLAVGDLVASSPRTASDTASWFGPLGLLLVLGAGTATLVLVRRRGLPRIAVVAASAPLLWFAVVALTLTYHPWQGRFFIAPVGLSAALWGLTLRTRALAWSAVAVAAVTALLSLDHFAEKPAGVRLLDRTRTSSVWHLERWEVQSQHDPALAPIFRFLDLNVPRHDSIALALGPNEFGFPAFGPKLERRVELVPFGSDAQRVSTRWLYADSQRAGEVDPACWHSVFRSVRGTVFARAPGCA
jgi:hypothetical protein